MKLTKEELNLLIEYLDARSARARASTYCTDGGDNRNYDDAVSEEAKAKAKLEKALCG
jgi:hypothetical protein